MKIVSSKAFSFTNNYKFLSDKTGLNDSKKILIVQKKLKIIYILIIILILLYSMYLIYYYIFLGYTKQKKIKNYFIPNTYRIVFVYGTRPEAIKLFPLIKQLKENKKFVCITINTGQHKEMIQQILNSLKMENTVDFNLNLMKNNQSLSQLTSKIISELEKIYNLLNPNAVIVQGDTTTSLAASISAFYQKIPIFHVEAGLRTHNLNNPFPEEFNRKSIDDISTLYFAPTEWSASNLLKENKPSNKIFVTGNTVVDSLKITLNNTNPSKYIENLIDKSKSLCNKNNECKIILLTCHRRENYFRPIYNILNAIQQLLLNFKDIVVIFPFHLNPNVRQSIRNSIPKEVYDDIIRGEKIEKEKYKHFNRLLIIPPLNYIDLVHLESRSYFIMSDSGGIQEEAVSIEKPILILRTNTERPEAVKSNCGFLTGTSYNKIYNYAASLLINKDLYLNLSKSKNVYGYGNSSKIISEIIQDYFENKTHSCISSGEINYKEILNEYDNSLVKDFSYNKTIYQNDIYDIVIILTVWKRNNLERQLIQVKNQSILKNKKTNIIIFQNSNHINVIDIVNKWKYSNKFSDKVDITFIQSPIETGYFGRFIIPLTSSVSSDSYFIICDDDVIWGNKYFENMIRVVDEGSLATRNGRIVTKDYEEISMTYKNKKLDTQVCYDEDIEYDFGGHIWAGRISWLRKAWNHIPISLENSEDFWISAVLKSFYGISTKIPKCPCPKENSIIPDLCAVSDKSAGNHEVASVGINKISNDIDKRKALVIEIIKKYNYQPLIISESNYVKSIEKKYKYGYSFFNLSSPLWKDALFWQ